MVVRAAYPPVLPYCSCASHLPEEWMAFGPLHAVHQCNRGVLGLRGGREERGTSENVMQCSMPLLCVLQAWIDFDMCSLVRG